MNIGFRPTRYCPLCGLQHEVKYTYKGLDVLICKRAEENKLMFFNDEMVTRELKRLSDIQRITDSRDIEK